MLERIVRTIFTIIIAGMLLGAQAIMSTSVKPVQVVSGGGTADIKVSKSGNSTEYSTVELSGKCLTPVHHDVSTNKWYYSSQLDMSVLEEYTLSQMNDYIMYGGYDFTTESKKDVYIRLELELDGNDELNKTLRVKVSGPYLGTYVLSADNNVIDTDSYINSNMVQSCNVYIWYELEDENCTIDNINNANGTNIQIKVGAYQKDA